MMSVYESACDLVCVGNAIVDMLAGVEPSVLEEFNAVAGSMMLIDAPMLAKLQQKVTIKQISGGGSAANTAVMAARMGLKTAYLGKVASDHAGKEFAADLKKEGVFFPSVPLAGDTTPTACCVVLVTPDGQRTMFTYLGACVEFTPEDVPEETVKQAAITYLEGYLFDKPHAQKAFYRAAHLAHQAGRKLALSLSDVFCIQRHYKEFRLLVAQEVDILFANEAEILALYDVDTIEQAIKYAGKDTNLAVITRGGKGALVVEGDQVSEVPAGPVQVVDTTGAGDAFAAGFLAGYSRGKSVQDAARLGNAAAGAVITHFGARPVTEKD